jgi:hypothetical protein
LKDLVSIRRNLLVALDNAKVAATYLGDLDTLAGVAREIREAAGELVDALRPLKLAK